MAHQVLVTKVEAADNLLEKDEGLAFRQAPALDEVVEQLAALDVLEHEEELLVAFVYVVQAEDVWVADELHECYLAAGGGGGGLHRDLSREKKKCTAQSSFARSP